MSGNTSNQASSHHGSARILHPDVRKLLDDMETALVDNDNMNALIVCGRVMEIVADNTSEASPQDNNTPAQDHGAENRSANASAQEVTMTGVRRPSPLSTRPISDAVDSFDAMSFDMPNAMYTEEEIEEQKRVIDEFMASLANSPEDQINLTRIFANPRAFGPPPVRVTEPLYSESDDDWIDDLAKYNPATNTCFLYPEAPFIQPPNTRVNSGTGVNFVFNPSTTSDTRPPPFAPATPSSCHDDDTSATMTVYPTATQGWLRVVETEERMPSGRRVVGSLNGAYNLNGDPARTEPRIGEWYTELWENLMRLREGTWACITVVTLPPMDKQGGEGVVRRFLS